MESYLALTATEMASCPTLPEKIAWMACHFSPYGTGLSNLPHELPPGSILILNDRIPICGHDPEKICNQLEQAVQTHALYALLLDLQRPDMAENAGLVQYLSRNLSCPLAVTEGYAHLTDTPVFLSPPPLNKSLEACIKPWQGRQLWLELALATQCFTVTGDGCRIKWVEYQALPHSYCDENLHCHYSMTVSRDKAEFILTRTAEDLQAHLAQAEALGITTAVGLYQELQQIKV